MNRPALAPHIVGIFLLSAAYWIYLSMSTRMEIVFDSVGYESLGRMLKNQGWIAYFKTGPNREPLYPLLIAISMTIEHVTGLAYAKIMAIFGVIMMFLTQVLAYKILRLLKIREGVCILVLAYLAFSPALNNAAFSLYSEIAAIPLMLGIVLASFHAWEAVGRNLRQLAFVNGAWLGILLTAATFVKGIFEFITPAYLIIFLTTLFFTDKEIKTKKIIPFILCMAAAISFYYVPITGYKWLNKVYNGNFAITDRGSWALYGNTARRMEPLTLKRFAASLAYAPGEGVCNSIFGPKECDFWSYKESDALGYGKLAELNSRHLSPQKIDTLLVSASAQKALHNPFQYSLLTFIEGLKMFFWESTKVGFVFYPPWLEKIYDIKILNNGLRFIMFILSFLGVVHLWLRSVTPGQSPLGLFIGVLVFLNILFFSFFFVLTRYALPMAPLYLVSVGILIDHWMRKVTHAKNH